MMGVRWHLPGRASSVDGRAEGEAMTTNGPPGPSSGPADPIAGGLDRRREGRNGEKPPEPEPPRVEVPPPAPIEPPKPGKKLKVDRFPAKLSKKQKKALKDAHRPLDSWERYRALTDVLDEAIDLVDLADHKARFALVIMAALNVVLFFVAVRTDLVREIPRVFQPFIGVYVLGYALVALYFFLQAIESLRPRKSQPQVPPVTQTGIEEFPLGIRFYEDILRRDVEDYKRAWKEVHVGQLNAELAVQAHALAGINRAKYGALRRLYSGLKLMTLLAVGLVGLAALATVAGTAREVAKAAKRGAKALGAAERIKAPGVKEPSGIAFQPGTGHLFVVGDEGALAELDGSGNLLGTTKIEAQIEDLTFHPPTGLFILISESRSELVTYDPATHQEKRRWPLDLAGIVGSTPISDKNQGFEGLAFRTMAGQPGGGIFYLTHQRSPAMVVALSFDPASPAHRIGADSVLTRWPMNFEDLTAITWVESIARLLVISDAKDRMLMIRPEDGAVEWEVPIPGQQQEGLALDGSGALWIADDVDKSVVHIKDVLPRLQQRVSGEAVESPGEEEERDEGSASRKGGGLLSP
jgi:uncharacterized protein YjiK